MHFIWITKVGRRGRLARSTAALGMAGSSIPALRSFRADPQGEHQESAPRSIPINPWSYGCTKNHNRFAWESGALAVGNCS
jgi:hypothetical protein